MGWSEPLVLEFVGGLGRTGQVAIVLLVAATVPYGVSAVGEEGLLGPVVVAIDPTVADLRRS